MQNVWSRLSRRFGAEPRAAELQASALRALIFAGLILCAIWAAAALILRTGWWRYFLRMTLVIEVIGVFSALAVLLTLLPALAVATLGLPAGVIAGAAIAALA